VAIAHGSAPSANTATQLWDGAGALDPEAQRINFSWLVRLRWGAIAGQAAAIACVHFAMDIPLPLGWLAGILVAAALYNVACAAWVRRKAWVREPMVALSMGGDVVLLTALLYFTGGPFNPFSFLYLVHIALAAVVLRSWWTWSLVALSLACFGALFIDPAGGSAHAGHMDHSSHAGHLDHAAPMDHSAHMHHPHAPAAGDPGAAHGSIMDMHLQGMWVAFGIAAAFIVYFVSRVTRDLAARDAELLRVRSTASRNEKLAALATLAAGAAHELATPLSTIAVAAKDLELGAPSAMAEDVRLIRREVDRCRTILRQMSVEAGQSGGEGVVPTRPEQLVSLALEGLAQRARVDVAIDHAAAERSLQLPAQALALALRGVLKNAVEAAGATGRVALRVGENGSGCSIEVRDEGTGMPASVLARVGEPFFTTKEPGQGMGLGLFVARALCEQIGGKLEIESTEGRGTTVRMNVPLSLPAQAKMEPA
jgi:two-component system sensor histidine kinase RegB